MKELFTTPSKRELNKRGIVRAESWEELGKLLRKDFHKYEQRVIGISFTERKNHSYKFTGITLKKVVRS